MQTEYELWMVHGWVHVSRGVTQLARQSVGISPWIEGFGCLFCDRRHISCSSAARTSQAGHRATDYSRKAHRHHHPTGCTQASWIPPHRASSNRLLSSYQQTRKAFRTHLASLSVKDDGSQPLKEWLGKKVRQNWDCSQIVKTDEVELMWNGTKRIK